MNKYETETELDVAAVAYNMMKKNHIDLLNNSINSEICRDRIRKHIAARDVFKFGPKKNTQLNAVFTIGYEDYETVLRLNIVDEHETVEMMSWPIHSSDDYNNILMDNIINDTFMAFADWDRFCENYFSKCQQTRLTFEY